jgi:hypothetical protein
MAPEPTGESLDCQSRTQGPDSSRASVESYSRCESRSLKSRKIFAQVTTARLPYLASAKRLGA